MGAMASPLTGAAGNVEFLLHARKGGRSWMRARPPPLGAAVSEAGDLTTADPAADRAWRPSPFLVHPERPDARALAADTAAWLSERGDTARILLSAAPTG